MVAGGIFPFQTLTNKTVFFFSGPSPLATLPFFSRKTSNVYLLHEMSQQYPDLMTFRTFFGGPTTNLVHNVDLIKKLFVQNADSFSNRPKLGWLGENLTKGKGTYLSTYKI